MKRNSHGVSRRRFLLGVGLPALIATSFFPAIADAHPVVFSDNGGTNGAVPPVLNWQPCGDIGAECTMATVPLDYDDPAGPTIEISVSRLPALDQANRIGGLFFNSGGPGGATAQLVREAGADIFRPALQQQFDIIGIDPRGVGDSTPIQCFASADEQAEVIGASQRIPITDEEVAASVASAQAYGEYCAANAGPLLSHMSTANVARDMDMIRQALGDEQLSFIGVSYGTHLGAVYANIFTHHVRAMVIDANLDAVAWTTGRGDEAETIPFDTRIQSAVGAADTIDAFLAECAEAGPEKCPLAIEGDPFDKWEALLAGLREEPIELPQEDGTTTTLTYSELVGLVVTVLYGSPEDWPLLASALQGLYSQASVPAAVETMEQMALATTQQLGFAPGDPFDDSFAAVTCSETDNPDNAEAWITNAEEQAAEFGAAGEFWAWGSLPCATWPVVDEDRYAGPWDIPTDVPILLINNFFDPATSFESAVELFDQLGNVQFLPVAGYGHVASLGKSTCADDAIDAYFLNFELPADDTVCTQDVIPFADVPPSSETPEPEPQPVPEEPVPEDPAPEPDPIPEPELPVP
jgi:pimeloyl-ACP methyl ester carboxylesterase